MVNISFQKNKVKYNVTSKSFFVKGSEVSFATTYNLLNERSGESRKFNFEYSTGSEWKVDTIWMYKSECGNYWLGVGNEEVTEEHANNYLRAKLQNS